MNELKQMQAVGGSNAAGQVPSWAVAASYLSRFLMLFMMFVVFCCTYGVDPITEVVSDLRSAVRGLGDIAYAVGAYLIGMISLVVVGFANDCRYRLKNGYWTRSRWGVQKHWTLEVLPWLLLLLAWIHVSKDFPARETVDGIAWRYYVSHYRGSATICNNHRLCRRAAIPVLTAGDLRIPSTLGGHPVKGIGEYAFNDCINLTSVTIPEGVMHIGAEAFNGCGNLKSVTMPDTVTYIGYKAFGLCSNLTSVTIPANVRIIDETAFEGTPLVEKAPDGLIVLSGIAYKWKGQCPSSVEIPEGVTRIRDNAFERCRGMKSLTMGNSVTNIGADAFHGCRQLASVTISANVASVGERAFYTCFNLKSIAIPRSLANVGRDAFFGCRVETIYVEKGDSERVRELLRGKGFDVDKVAFVEREAHGLPKAPDNPETPETPEDGHRH